MSNLEPRPRESVSPGPVAVAHEPVRDVLPGREVVLGGTRGMAVTRTLPTRDRSLVGAWCFVDHFGGAEHTLSGGAEHTLSGPRDAAMRVPPHPHTGLQTVTWLVEGEVRHTDSLGSDQVIRPGQLNLMTAGRGIAHAEVSPPDASAVPHGLQLWVALPEAFRWVDPGFSHHADLPTVALGDGAVATVLLGELAGAVSPATAYTPIVGAEVTLATATAVQIPLVSGFEYAVVTISGAPLVDGVVLPRGCLLYLGCGRTSVPVQGPARLLLIGGEPFAEEIVMWWNFIGRSHDEIVAAREDWMAGIAAGALRRGRGGRFGTVRFDGDPLPAPALPGIRLKPRGRTR